MNDEIVNQKIQAFEVEKAELKALIVPSMDKEERIAIRHEIASVNNKIATWGGRLSALPPVQRPEDVPYTRMYYMKLTHDTLYNMTLTGLGSAAIGGAWFMATHNRTHAFAAAFSAFALNGMNTLVMKKRGGLHDDW